MAKKKGAKPETKSEFLRKVLGKDPDPITQHVNRRLGEGGACRGDQQRPYYKVRAELGIKTEWVRVKEEDPK